MMMLDLSTLWWLLAAVVLIVEMLTGTVYLLLIAAAFVAATGVDALAVAVGSSHAMTTRTARLDHGLIAALHDAVPVPLVLHGSSGVPADELARAVSAGITKINVGTALNVAMTASLRDTLDADPDVTDPRRYLAPARLAMRETVLRLLHEMG